ncbi:cytochrome c peroxidase [Thiogranum longum]|uniref:Cytochrome c peroxidase n=1 Tax=Thiogranum longum TaxID=1537524 RepID=A0A4R1HEE0_9GAMM|nr:cytochrome c peroxidase [Thiogranum longum]TCK19013.1 cytochrome c peroxidase [Thiogranum longum]
MPTYIKFIIVLLLLAGTSAGGWYWVESQKYPKPPWTEQEKGAIASLWIGSLPELSPDPGNTVAGNPVAARFGHQLFFDERFSGNGEVACATCHIPSKYFTDGLPVAVGMGVGGRNVPTVVGTAYHPFLFWDGHVDSQWAQALGPMESPVEHGGSRLQYAHLIAADDSYRHQYEVLFGKFPDLSDQNRFPAQGAPVSNPSDPAIAKAWKGMSEVDKKTIGQIYSNLGKVIAAYERLLLPAAARFDHYAEALQHNNSAGLKLLSPDEVEGLRLFIGEARCIECHNGPLFSNDGFHNIGSPVEKGKPYDWGRSIGVQKVLRSEFNCLGEYSDAQPEDCSELRFIKRVGDDLAGSFKVPGLRNVTQTAPYMHNGQLADLDAVMDHYNKAPVPPFGHSMLVKLDLAPRQLKQLTAFLHTLDSAVNADVFWLNPPESGQPYNSHQDSKR